MEANWPAVIALAGVAWGAMWVARLWFGRWFNPLTLYSAIWGFCLVTCELRLIRYERISLQAWTYIGLAWAALYLGSATVWLWVRPGNRTARQPSQALPIEPRRLETAILILCLVGLVGLIGQLRSIYAEFGSVFSAIFVNAVAVYTQRTTGQITWIPYVGSFAFAACALAGVYTGMRGKVTIYAVIPVLLIGGEAILAMSRMGLVMAVLLFAAGLLHVPRATQFHMTRMQVIVAIGVIAVLMTGSLFFVSSIRGLAVDFPGRTPAIDSITEIIPFFPSFYANFSAPPVAFSLYLASPETDHAQAFWGMYTFAPFFRFSSKFGFPTSVPPYEENYFTPVPVNTSTYLKNVASDFGLPGIIGFPYLLGVALTLSFLRMRSRRTLLPLILLASFYPVVALSFMFNIMLTGDWFIATIVAVFTCILIQPTLSRIPVLGPNGRGYNG